MSEPLKAIELADYLFTGRESDEEVIRLLRDPLRRICNLYWIKDADGHEIKFVPNFAQRVVLYVIYILGVKRLAIPKARQLGFSTLFAIICLDETHFSNGKQASIVDQTQADASEKLDKVRFAWEKLPADFRREEKTNNGTELEFQNSSRIIGGKRARGGTNQVLHISEWGPIAFDDPARSTEIKTGAIPSVSGETGKIFAESTHKGGKGGDWYDLIKRSLETPPEHRTAKDFEVLFFPWYLEPRYVLEGDFSQISKECHKYLDELEPKLGVKFTPQQRLFYFVTLREQGDSIFAEYPTTLEETWKVAVPGAIYSAEVDKARIQGRISANVLHYAQLATYSVFDIGAPCNTKCWIFQAVGDRINLLEAISGDEECATAAAWVKRLKDKTEYNWGGHFLPHDGETVWRASMQEAGLSGVVCLPKPHFEWDNINDAIAAFGRCYFNQKQCEDGLNSLEAYRSKQEADGMTIRNTPVHDWASHYSTAFGYVHQAIRLGMLVDRSAMPRKPSHGRPIVHLGVTPHATAIQRKVRILR